MSAAKPIWMLEQEPSGTWRISVLLPDGNYQPMVGGFTSETHAGAAWAAVFVGLYTAANGGAAQSEAASELVTALRRKMGS